MRDLLFILAMIFALFAWVWGIYAVCMYPADCIGFRVAIIVVAGLRFSYSTTTRG